MRGSKLQISPSRLDQFENVLDRDGVAQGIEVDDAILLPAVS